MHYLLVLVGVILMATSVLNLKGNIMAWHTQIDDPIETAVAEAMATPTTTTPAAVDVGNDTVANIGNVYRQGDRDAGPNGDIRSAQTVLNRLGTSVGEVDGVYGRNTMNAVQDAQEMLGLPRTGVLDQATQDAFNNLTDDQIDFFTSETETMAAPEAAPEAAEQETPTSLPSDNIVDTSLSENENNTTLSRESIESQVRNLVGTNIRAAGILGAFSKEAGSNFDNLEENTNYSLANAEAVPFSTAKINSALASLDPEVRQKIQNGGRDRRFGEALMSHYGGGGRYHGRGLIHITHDYNYRAVGDRIGVDLVANPDLVKDPRYAVPAALAYLEINGYFNADTEVTRDSLHNIVNRHAGNSIRNSRWANAQTYLRGWQGEAAAETSPRPQERPETTTE